MSEAVPASTEAQAADPPSLEPAAPTEAEAKPEEGAQQEPAKKSAGNPEQSRGADGRFKEKQTAADEETQPADTEDKQVSEDAAASAQLMSEAAEKIQSMQQQLKDYEEKTKAMETARVAAKEEADKLLKAAADTAEKEKKAREKAEEEKVKTVNDQRRKNLEELRRTLASVGQAVPESLQLENGSDNAKQVGEFERESEVAAAAINSINLFKQQADQAMNSNDNLKRSLTGFAGNALPQQRLGQVNASAQGDAKRARTEPVQEQPSDFLEWRKQHPNALLNEVNHNFKLMMEQSSATMSGVVNASRTGQPWTASSLQFKEQRNPYECVHAGALHPELFQGICNMNTGRMPSDSDSEKLCTNLMETLAQRHRY